MIPGNGSKVQFSYGQSSKLPKVIDHNPTVYSLCETTFSLISADKIKGMILAVFIRKRALKRLHDCKIVGLSQPKQQRTAI